jgi:sugar fermentation stimulation protein A
MMLITTPLVRAKVLKRPSATIRSPYVADIQLEDGQIALCHTPGLGCGGMVATDQYIYVSTSSAGSKTAYTAQLAELANDGGYVGIHPMIAQTAAHSLLPHIATDVVWSKEVRIDAHSRIDYVGLCSNGRRIYVEVKQAMLSADISKPVANRYAIFPDGYRKKITDTISPRAVKHAELLADLVKRPDTEMCVLLFVVSRTDCDQGLSINPADPIYRDAVQKAKAAGVQIRAFSLRYAIDGSIMFDKECPVDV